MSEAVAMQKLPKNISVFQIETFEILMLNNDIVICSFEQLGPDLDQTAYQGTDFSG